MLLNDLFDESLSEYAKFQVLSVYADPLLFVLCSIMTTLLQTIKQLHILEMQAVEKTLIKHKKE